MAKAIETLSIKLDFKAGSGSQQIIDKIGKSIKDLKKFASATAPSIEKVRRSINDFAKQGNQSISSIEGQVTALRALRREADINSKEFKELTADIGRYEKQLNKAQGRRGGGGARQATQVAGAVISGGIFGGPEGALGGLGGAAFGGVQGAFAGAAIGAQVGGIRKAIGAAADYAAQIQKLEIGLRGVVSSESEFHQAIAAANSATKDFNISAIDSITGITRLSAAVVGAGGNLTDVEIVFRGISSAVLATGGSADDVRSAITAMVQVFSKGKVSAEELSGQLGERLPGAVVRFAKAAYGEGPAAMQKLQKELKAGSVGLKELMLFAKDSGLEFEELAKKIAGSSASAGARLNILVDAFRRELGTAIQPVGAQIQDFAGEVLVEFKDEIIGVVKELGNLVLGLLNLAKFIGENKETIGFFADLALKVTAAKLALDAFAGIQTAYAGLVAAGTQAKITGDVAATATGKVKLLKGALTSLAAIGIITVGVDLAVKGFGRFMKMKGELETLRGNIKDPSAQFKGKTVEEVEAAQAAAREKLPGLRAQLAGKESAGGVAADVARFLLPAFEKKLTGQGFEASMAERKTLPEQIKALEATLKVDASKFAGKPKETKFKPTTPNGDGDGDGKGKGKDNTQARIDSANEIVRRLRDQLRIQQSQGEIGKLIGKQAKERSNLEAAFQRLLKEGANTKVRKLLLQAQMTAKDLLAQKQALELERKTKAVIESATKPLEAITKSIHEKIRADKEYARLIAEGINPELAKQLVEINKQFDASKHLLDLKIAELQAAVDTASAEERTTEAFKKRVKAIEDLEDAKKGLPKEKEKAEGAAKELHKEDTFLEGLDKHIGELEKNLKKLTDPLNQVKAAGEAIGESFKTAFRGLIDGSMTAREAMASFFQGIADHFLDMAAEIAAAAIKLAAIRFVSMIVGSFAGGGGDAGGKAVAQGSSIFAAAEGAYVPGGFKAFSQGGMVNKPTLGLVGEGGEPEYIIPQSKMRESMGRYARGSRGSSVIPAGGGGGSAGAEGGTAVAAPIDVRYTVERINSVDYVTADQFQSGMRQAAEQGASQGEQRTFRRLKMSSSARRGIGI
jgi:tape measure domain-containing protein